MDVRLKREITKKIDKANTDIELNKIIEDCRCDYELEDIDIRGTESLTESSIYYQQFSDIFNILAGDTNENEIDQYYKNEIKKIRNEQDKMLFVKSLLREIIADRAELSMFYRLHYVNLDEIWKNENRLQYLKTVAGLFKKYSIKFNIAAEIAYIAKKRSWFIFSGLNDREYVKKIRNIIQKSESISRLEDLQNELVANHGYNTAYFENNFQVSQESPKLHYVLNLIEDKIKKIGETESCL